MILRLGVESPRTHDVHGVRYSLQPETSDNQYGEIVDQMHVQLNVGDQIKFGRSDEWWTVKAVTENFAALTTKGWNLAGDDELHYTVIDWRNSIRGPCNLIGGGYGDGTYTEQQCAEMLDEFEYDYKKDPDYIEAMRRYEAGEIERVSWPSKPHLEISYRNRVPLSITGLKRRWLVEATSSLSGVGTIHPERS